MSNTVEILEAYWSEHPAWFGRPYGEYLHLGANQEMLRMALSGVELGADDRVLDLSCALGGNARWLASKYGCRVEGIDPFKPAVVAARQLAKAQGLTELCRFTTGKVDDLPWGNDAFQLAVATEGDVSSSEVSRVLVPGGVFFGTAIVSEGGEAFRQLVTTSGFEVAALIDVTKYALAFYRAKEEEAKLLVDAGLMPEDDMHALQMHTVDMYDAGGASHVAFRVTPA